MWPQLYIVALNARRVGWSGHVCCGTCCRVNTKWWYDCTARQTGASWAVFNCASSWNRRNADGRCYVGGGHAKTCWHLPSENVKLVHQSPGSTGIRHCFRHWPPRRKLQEDQYLFVALDFVVCFHF